jgi:Xaa-Pro dipeptidase
MPKPYIHFTLEEFADRQARVRSALAERGMDGLLLSRIEDQYWLCGLDTDGFVIFHIMFIGVDGQLTHLTRTADLASIDFSSICRDIRVWEDAAGSPKSKAVKEMLASHGMQGKRIGIQLDTFGLLPNLYLELKEALDGWCELVDASDVVRLMRLVKSPAELDHQRRAGEVLDRACARAIELTDAGADESYVFGQVYQVMWESGADIPAERIPMGHGEKAMNVRYATGRGSIDANDQVTYEMGCAWRHYHVADMFTVLTGPQIDPRHLRMHAACVDALAEVQDTLRPGRTLGEVYEVHRATLAKHGYEKAALKACGYTMGATFSPTWMEMPMMYRDNPTVIEKNMVLFTHMILSDFDTGLTMSLGETSIVTEGKPEVITHVPREPIVRSPPPGGEVLPAQPGGVGGTVAPSSP